MIIPAKYKPELCASRDDYRLIINYLYLCGNLLYATDGRRAIQIQVTLEEGDVDGFIPVSVLKEVRSVQPRKKGRFTPAELHILCKANKLSFDSRFGPIEIERPNPGNYPNMKQVITAFIPSKKHTLALNVKRLYGVAEALGTEEIVLRFDDDTSPIVIVPQTFDSPSPHATHAILMPSRIP